MKYQAALEKMRKYGPVFDYSTSAEVTINRHTVFIQKNGYDGHCSSFGVIEVGHKDHPEFGHWETTYYQSITRALAHALATSRLEMLPYNDDFTTSLRVAICYKGASLKATATFTLHGTIYQDASSEAIRLATGFIDGTTPACVILDFLTDRGDHSLIAIIDQVRKMA